MTEEDDKNAGSSKSGDECGGVYYETAIEETGYGRFHLTLVAVGCLCMMSSGFENALNAYILPSAQCDLQMTTRDQGNLNVIFLAGSISSAFLSGVLADVCGRKTVLLASMTLDAAILLASSCSQSLNFLLGFRFLSGFVSGAPASLSIPYVGEFHARGRRTTSVCYVGFFWALSWMLAPGIAWLIIPQTWSYQSKHFKYNSWRMFVAFFSVPCALGAIFMTFLPESPRFLLATGKVEEAFKVLKKMYSVNTGNPPEKYPLSLAQLYAATENFESEDDPVVKAHKADSFKGMFKSMWLQTTELVRPPYLSYTCICASLMACNMVGGYGFGLWLPELIQRFVGFQKSFPNETVTVCTPKLNQLTTVEFNETIWSNLTNLSNHTTSVDCGKHVVDSLVFFNTIIIGISCLVGNVFYAIVANHVSQRRIVAVPMIMGGACALTLYFLSTTTQILIISCIFQTGIEVAYFGIYSVVLENFPTRIRAMAMCNTILAGRIAAIMINLLFGDLLDSRCEIPIFLTAAVLFVGIGFSYLIPPTRSYKSDRRSSAQAEGGTTNSAYEVEDSDTRL